jgi:hypothetical protein
MLLAGGVALFSALPLLATAVALRFVFRSADEEGDPFVKAMLDLGVDSMSVPIRNALAVSLFGLLVLIMATAILWWSARQAPPGAGPLGEAV